MNDLGIIILAVAIVTAVGLATVLICSHLDRIDRERHDKAMRDLAMLADPTPIDEQLRLQRAVAANRAHRATHGRWA